MNKFVAKLKNTSPTIAAPAIHAKFRIAGFGLSGGLWNATDGRAGEGHAANPSPSGGVDIPAGGSKTIELDWLITSGVDTTLTFSGVNLDQCVWVELTTAAALGGPAHRSSTRGCSTTSRSRTSRTHRSGRSSIRSTSRSGSSSRGSTSSCCRSRRARSQCQPPAHPARAVSLRARPSAADRGAEHPRGHRDGGRR